MHTFETPGPITVVVRSGAGRVTVSAEDTQRTTVELTAQNSAGEDAVAEARVEQQRSSVIVDLPRHRGGLFRPHPSVAIAITCPRDSILEVRCDSADVHANGTYAEAIVTTGSGDVLVEDVTGTAKIKSGSGAVSARTVGKGLVMTTGSGDVSVDRTGRSASLTSG